MMCTNACLTVPGTGAMGPVVTTDSHLTSVVKIRVPLDSLLTPASSVRKYSVLSDTASASSSSAAKTGASTRPPSSSKSASKPSQSGSARNPSRDHPSLTLADDCTLDYVFSR
eukprot:2479259-Rhodomonas_salina.2